MNQDQRPRKRIDSSRNLARGRTSPVKEVARGELKGKPLADEQVGPKKASVKAARQAAVGVERTASSRRDLPLPRERPDTNGKAKAGSLRLRLIVDGEHIRVLSAQEVDAPSTLPERVRGTHFLEVRVGNELLALDRLVDPGLAVGTPDPRDTSHSRGHRVVELASYELTVRVPLDALETVVSRSLQGLPAEAQSLSVPLEIAVYRATENLAIEPRRFDVLQATRSGQFVRTATTGQLNLDEVRRSVGGAQKPAS